MAAAWQDQRSTPTHVGADALVRPAERRSAVVFGEIFRRTIWRAALARPDEGARGYVGGGDFRVWKHAFER